MFKRSYDVEKIVDSNKISFDDSMHIMSQSKSTFCDKSCTREGIYIKFKNENPIYLCTCELSEDSPFIQS